jgi:predicted nuclease of predicted toxin-antitoxin system
VRFLVDNALSFRVAEELKKGGHDAVHVLDYKMGGAEDLAIFQRAASEDRVIVSTDTDCGTILAQQKTSKPSVILLRWPLLRDAVDQATVILANLPNIHTDLETGAVVIIEPSQLRVRRLPVGGE